MIFFFYSFVLDPGFQGIVGIYFLKCMFLVLLVRES